MAGYARRMSRREAMDALQEQLGAKPPGSLSRLSEEEIADLVEALQAAKQAQAVELRTAGEKAYAQIPWLLRGPIRKIMS
jgi:hypothetical protein